MAEVRVLDMVHYVMPNWAHRPAIVVNCWQGTTVVDLVVFPDGENDGPEYGRNNAAVWFPNVSRDDSCMVGTWHWPGV